MSPAHIGDSIADQPSGTALCGRNSKVGLVKQFSDFGFDDVFIFAKDESACTVSDLDLQWFLGGLLASSLFSPTV